MKLTRLMGSSVVFAAAAALLVAVPAGAADKKTDKKPELSGRDIMDKAYNAQRVEISANMKMILADGKGGKKERKFEGRGKKFTGLWKTYQKFEAPPDIAGTQFLVLENKGLADNDLYLYEPVNKRTRKINPAQRSGRYVGSDYFYEDIDVYDVDEDKHTLVKSETLELKAGDKTEKVDCWVIESLPVPSKVTSYNKIVSWVQKSNFYTRQSEMYQQDKLVKRFRVFDVKQDGDKWISMLSQMDDLKAGTSTILQTEKYDLNASAIPDKIFTESYLLSGG